MKKPHKPSAGKGKKTAKTTAATPALFFIPALGTSSPTQQFTREGWERVSRP